MAPADLADSDYWRGRSCLVTGASGFVGQALSRRLLRMGALVTGLCRSAPADGTSSRWLCGDVTDQAFVRRSMLDARPATIFHLASIVSGSRDIHLTLPMLATNLQGFVNVAMAARDVGNPRLICMGSLQEPDQTLPAVPASPYAAAKFAASCYARMFAATYDMPVTIARPLMVYGGGQMDFSKIVPYVIQRLLQGHSADLSSGAQHFDWVHVDDVVEALLEIASRDGLNGRTIDIGTGVSASVADVVGFIAKTLDARRLLRFGTIADRRGEPTRVADVRATESLTGWRSRIDLKSGLERTIRWYQSDLHAGGLTGKLS